MAQAMLTILAKVVERLSPFPAEAWTTLRSCVFTTYHPEQHYMRGPGPKWREKHPGSSMAA